MVDADWNTWVTSAMHDGWGEQESWQGESWNGDSAQADGSEPSNANSLIISMMQGVADEFEETGLFLEGSGSAGSRLTLGSLCDPQPFLEGSCSGKGSKKRCNSVLCGCPECVVEGKRFTQAWSTQDAFE